MITQDEFNTRVLAMIENMANVLGEQQKAIGSLDEIAQAQTKTLKLIADALMTVAGVARP